MNKPRNKLEAHTDDFAYRFIGMEHGEYLFSKDKTYFKATLQQLRGLAIAIEHLVKDGPKDGGWKICLSPSGQCVCANLEDEGDRELPICEDYRKSGSRVGCDECGHDKGCHQ